MNKIHRAIVLVALGVVLVGASPASGGSGASLGWLDMKNCDICAPFTAEKGLMDHMSWEPYETATGEICVTSVSPDYAAAYARASAKCDELVGRAMKGEKLDLCGYCTGLLGLGQAGAKIEKFETKAGHVMLVSDTNPETVKQIHSHAQRTVTELKTAMANK